MHSYHQSLRWTSSSSSSHIQPFPFPKAHKDEQGWEKTGDGSLEPLWSCGPILPPSLVDLIPDMARELDDTDDEQEIDYDELF